MVIWEPVIPTKTPPTMLLDEKPPSENPCCYSIWHLVKLSPWDKYTLKNKDLELETCLSKLSVVVLPYHHKTTWKRSYFPALTQLQATGHHGGGNLKTSEWRGSRSYTSPSQEAGEEPHYNSPLTQFMIPDMEWWHTQWLALPTTWRQSSYSPISMPRDQCSRGF